MLNTEASFKYDLNEDYSICHLLNNFPQLSKCLFISLIWELKLDKYFYESLIFTPSWFMTQFLEEAIDSLRHAKSLEAIWRVQSLIEAIYKNICRMDYRPINASNLVDQKIILNKLFDYTMSLLRHYNTPNSDPELTKSKKKMRIYLGHSLSSIMSLVLMCFKLYQNKPTFSIAEEHKIFHLMQEKEPEADNFSTKCYSAYVNDSLMKLNFALLNTLQNSVMGITLDDFVYWVEIDIADTTTEDEDLKNDNLQKAIGTSSYNIISIINENGCFEHDVVKQLSTISIKPNTLREIAKEATVGTVLEKIESSINRRIWFEELLDRGEALYFNTECLQTIVDNIALVQLKDLLRILKDHQNYGEMDDEDDRQIKEIFGKAANQLTNLEIRDLIEELIRTLGTSYTLSLDDLKLSLELNNYMNQITEANIDENRMWILILQNPQEFYRKLLENASDQDEKQLTIIFKVVSETSSIACDFVKDIIQDSLSIDGEKKTSLHLFLAGIFKLNIIARKEFIKDVLMDNMAKALANEDYATLHVLTNALKQIVNKLKIEDLIPPLTLLMAHILDKCRWDLMTFNQLREAIVERSILILQNLNKTIVTSGCKRDKDWIQTKIEACKPMTKFYFQKLSLERNSPIVQFDKFLHSSGFDGAAKSKITSFLCETIVRSTTKEFKWLMSNENLQLYINDALLVITVIVSKSNEECAINCLRKCVSDYVKILMVRNLSII